MTPLPQLAAPLVGHPLIIVLQLVAFALGIWLFLEGRNRPLVIRVLYFALPFVTLANVLARTYRLEWLYLTDIVFWSLMVVSLISACLYARNEKKITSELIAALVERGIDPVELGLRIAKPDIFSLWHNQILIVSVAVAFGLVSYNFIRTYGEKQLEQQEQAVEVQQEGNRIKKEEAASQQELLSGVASLSAVTETMLGGLVNLQRSTDRLSQKVSQKTSALKPMAVTTNKIKEDVSDIKVQVENGVSKPDTTTAPANAPVSEKPNLLQRLKKRLFGVKMPVTTVPAIGSQMPVTIIPIIGSQMPISIVPEDSLYQVQSRAIGDSLVLN